MIGFLRGKVILKQVNVLIIDTGGVGYEVSVPISLMEHVNEGEDCDLFIHHNVREDGHYLFGFTTLAQRQLFRELIRVSGIGPKLALLILSGFSVEALTQVIHEQNAAALIQLPGIGKKTAERLLIELNDRVGKDFVNVKETAGQSGISKPNPAQDTQEALVALGYKPLEAAKLVEKVSAELGSEVNSDILLKKALQYKFQSGR